MSERPPRMRLFVAIELPQPWLDALADLQARIKSAIEKDPSLAGQRLRWVRPEGIHITLKFIGEVDPDRLEAITHQLDGALAVIPPVTLAPAPVGSFGERRAPRVVWAGVHETPPGVLQGLADRVESQLEGAGIRREGRPFRAHLTLARMPDGLTEQQKRRAAEIASSVVMPDIAAFGVENVSLMRSFIGPGGARYERLKRWPG